MNGWQITEFNELKSVKKVEALDGVDCVKVRITRSLITEEDVALMAGVNKNLKLPYIPCSMAVGQITAVGPDVNYLQKGQRVYLSPMHPCGKCYHCINGDEENCYEFEYAGKNKDGFLKDFAVLKASDVFLLPDNVKDDDVVYVEYIKLALSVVNALNFEKGQHVAILGGNVVGVILAQIISYYQGVPIIIDKNEENLRLAKQSGIYYTVLQNENTVNEISAITGARMVANAVYITDLKLSTTVLYNVVSPRAKVVFMGTPFRNVEIPFNLAMSKNIISYCVTDGYLNSETAINLLAMKAVDLSKYELTPVKLQNADKEIKKRIDLYNSGEKYDKILIDCFD